MFGGLVYAQKGHEDLRLQCGFHPFKSQNFKREGKHKLLGKSYLKPSYLRLRSSCYFTWEFPCLAFTHNNSVGFCSKLGWTFSPDAWPLLDRRNSKSSPGKVIDILLLQKSWKPLWLEHVRKHFRPVACQQGYIIGSNLDCSCIFSLASGRNGNAGDDCSWLVMQLNTAMLCIFICHTQNRS